MLNFREGVRGYLFQGRFHSTPLDERHLLCAVRYVERNPVRARMADEAWQYEWSSARYHAGMESADPLIKDADRALYGMVGGDEEWRDFLRADPSETETRMLQKTTRSGRPCGDESFVNEVERLTQRQLHPRRPGRPRKIEN